MLKLLGFLLIRVLKTGEDKRFDEMRDNFWKFLGFWIFQMIWVWIGLSITVESSFDSFSWLVCGFIECQWN
jgi:hypothetical protein